MFEIRKQFTFEASHQLFGMPTGHKCGRLHGHSYRVEVVLRAETLDARGFVRDYGDMDSVKHFIDRNLDHRHLNEIDEALEQPTAEAIARWLFCEFKPLYPELDEVRISETQRTWASYRER